ncbi:MAG: DUF5655 domain-containing protein [Candidatus Kapaibacterium sp.]
MPIFEIENGNAKRIRLSEFKLEKDLQKLVENNLETIFSCQFIATEFSTGNIHSGRIDTLALSEDQNPVIIEYKKTQSSDLINQSLYYLHWIIDHKGDFKIAANSALGAEVEVDWSDVRVICLAPEFKKYDLHAVQVMGANIELWQYKLYENGILAIEEVFRQRSASHRPLINSSDKKSEIVNPGPKTADTGTISVYTVEEHTAKLSPTMTDILDNIRDYITSLDSSIQEIPKKKYIAYKTSQNFVCIQTNKKKICLYLKLNPGEMDIIPENGRDVSNIGHYGTGDFELTISSAEDLERSKDYIFQAYKNIGG